MAVSLRPYQTRAIADLRAAYAAGKRAPCLVLPTGAGKTRCAAAIIRAALDRNNPTLFLAHRKELITQSVAKLAEAGVTDVRVIRAEHDDGNPDAPVTVASIPTLIGERWLDRLPEAALVILDECQHASCESWSGLAGRYRRARLLGLTATPERGDGAALGDIFDALVVGATVRELTDLKFLAPLRVWSPPAPMEPGKLALTPLEAYRAHGDGRLALVFCTRVEDARRYADEMTTAGIAADVVHGELGERRRDDILARFAAGELRVLVNCGVLTEGTDLPEATVCILARLPRHPGLFLQIVGRVLRTHPNKTHAILVDLCGSVLIHGTPEMDRTYSLEGKAISKVDSVSVRQCPNCGGVFESARAADGRCPLEWCGAALPAQPRKQLHNSGAGVEEVTDLQRRRARTLDRNLAELARRGHLDENQIEAARVAIGGVR